MEWVRFLDENNIHYVTRGPNTKRGEVSVQCPMCGDADPSEHCGINLHTGEWGCHRDANHRGKSPRTLVRALLGCSWRQARFIVEQYDHSDPDSLEAALATLEAEDKPAEKDAGTPKANKRELEAQFRDFKEIKPRGTTYRFFRYLQHREYINPQEVIERYELRCALTGKYQDRIILPVRMNGELLGWTSRAIVDPVNAPRYLMSSDDVKSTIFNYDAIKKGGKRLFIVEGPFDALKVDSFAQAYTYSEVRATCTFGTSVTIPQIALLRNLIKHYSTSYVLFDKGAEGPSEELASWLGITSMHLPPFVKDPGELTPDEVWSLCH